MKNWHCWAHTWWRWGGNHFCWCFVCVCVCAINKIKSICSHICWNNKNKKQPSSPPCGRSSCKKSDKGKCFGLPSHHTQGHIDLCCDYLRNTTSSLQADCVSDWGSTHEKDGAKRKISHTYIYIYIYIKYIFTAQLKRPKLVAAITAIQPNRDISIFRLLWDSTEAVSNENSDVLSPAWNRWIRHITFHKGAKGFCNFFLFQALAQIGGVWTVVFLLPFIYFFFSLAHGAYKQTSQRPPPPAPRSIISPLTPALSLWDRD